MKESKKEFKHALRACRKSQQKCKADAMAEALRNRSPKKNSGRASEKARNYCFHLQWEEKQEIKAHLKALVFLYAFEESVDCHLLSCFCDDSKYILE